jgi:hypothetical protein
MPTYSVTDPTTGKKVRLTGDSPPTEAELTEVFASLGASPASESGGAGTAALDVAKGVGKGALNTAIGLGELVHRIPGVSRAVDAVIGQPGLSDAAFTDARARVQPTNTAQRVGFSAEQIGEFFIPGAKAGKLATVLPTKAAPVVTRGAQAALQTGAQSGSGTDAGVSAVLANVIPGAGAVKKAAGALSDASESLVRAAIKPTVASLRKITGAGGMDAKANALVRFIIDNRLTTPEKARALFQQTEHELQRVLSVKNAPTDAATRAAKYLDALERSAAKQGLGADDVKLLRQAADDLVAGPMGQTVTGPSGAARVLRSDVPAAEALDSARASSRWTTRKAWGEQKGASMEASKAVERAQRDAVKAAVPEAAPLLAKEGKALTAESVLDRMAQRQGNREGVSMPAQITGAVEIASGNVPVLAIASNWLRNNGMKAGIWADALSKAIERGNAPMAADILKRLGVGVSSQTMRTATAP